MRNKLIALTFGLLSLATMAGAQATTCSGNPTPIADGTQYGYYFAAATSNYFFVQLMPHHSYSVEANYPSAVMAYPPSISFHGGGCSKSTPVTDVSYVDPSFASAYGRRVSFIDDGSYGDYGFLQIANADLSKAYYYDLRFTDTTLHNPRWSTFSGFITQYGFKNTTRSNITATLTVATTLGSTLAPVVTTFTIPANSEVFKIVGPTGDVVVPGQHGGFAELAYIGPTGAVQADAYFIGSGSIVPAKFEPRNYQH